MATKRRVKRTDREPRKNIQLAARAFKQGGRWAFEVIGCRDGRTFFHYCSSPAYDTKDTAEQGMDRWLEDMREAFS